MENETGDTTRRNEPHMMTDNTKTVEAVARVMCFTPSRIGPNGNRVWVYYVEAAEAAISTHTATLKEQGYVIVPIEPTVEMIRLGTKSHNQEYQHSPITNIYKAMLEAAGKEMK